LDATNGPAIPEINAGPPSSISQCMMSDLVRDGFSFSCQFEQILAIQLRVALIYWLKFHIGINFAVFPDVSTYGSLPDLFIPLLISLKAIEELRRHITQTVLIFASSPQSLFPSSSYQ
jgi:hypothetical protein